MNCIKQEIKDNYSIYCGDSVEIIKEIPNNSIGYSLFSPPFEDLYVYNDSERDMGNSKNTKEFWNHFNFLIIELFRIMKNGRCVSIHCTDIPIMKEKEGYIGIRDFPGDIIRAFQKVGFIFHSRVVIWKDPLIEATRTKALGLLYKQICKDSAMCRQGMADYIITMRKPGENQESISHEENIGLGQYAGSFEIRKNDIKYNHRVWQIYASPVWTDIRQTYTLQFRSVRGDKDEKHICPLQLDTVHRCIVLWTNPGDIVFDPFMGIGTVPYKSIELGRKGIGFELKESYYTEARKNLRRLIRKNENDLLSEVMQ